MLSLRPLLLAASLLASLAAAVPPPLQQFHTRPTATTHRHRRDARLAADIIADIMPKSTSCAGAAFPDECRTNVQAAPYLITALQQYQVTEPAAIAAVLALVGYESDDMAYKHNVVPGVAGQGTSNMQSPANNALYAKSIPALASDLSAAGGDVTKVLALVTPDAYNFGSGPWYLTTQCAASVLAQFATDKDAAFAAYMGCIYVSATDQGRQEYWARAKTAFGL